MEPRPPRVLFLASGLAFGGVERWCLDTAAALRRRDLEVLVACAPASELEARATGAGLPTTVFDVDSSVLPLAGFALSRLMTRAEVDVVVSNTDRETAVGAVACALSGRALVERRGRSEAPSLGFLRRWLHRNYVRRVVANCGAVVDRLATSAPFVPKTKVVLIENAAPRVRTSELDRAAARAELDLPEDALAVGYLGPLAVRKGLENLLAAWRTVAANEARARLLLAGGGELEHVLDRRLAEPELASARRVGVVADPVRFLSALDLFVLPSVRDEGSSHALLEAQSTGLAAVVTNCGGNPELVESGRTGRVAPKNHPDSLAAAIGDLLADKRLRRDMGERARREVGVRHDPERIGDAWEALLREVAGGEPALLSGAAN